MLRIVEYISRQYNPSFELLQLITIFPQLSIHGDAAPLFTDERRAIDIGVG